MSEFSDSYHLKTNDPTDAVKLLKRAEVKGYVFPESQGWVTLVAEGDEMMPNKNLIRKNEGTLIHFVYAEDHGWYISIYKEIDRVSHYECMWPDTIEVWDSELNLDVLMELVEQNVIKQKIGRDEIKRLLYPQSFEDIFEDVPILSRIASVLGLNNYRGVSFQYIEQGYIKKHKAYTDLIYVKGIVK